jgi:hypothetical protein
MQRVRYYTGRSFGLKLNTPVPATIRQIFLRIARIDRGFGPHHCKSLSI